MSKLRVLSLFSGIGGIDLGLERTGGFETAAFCEIDPFCQKILAKHWPGVPCFDDVSKLTREDIDGPIDLVCGGYPCQPFSTAGKRAGKEDNRHLWPEVNRLLDEFRPDWFLGENVSGHISMGLDDVLLDLENKGYACRTFVIPACAVGAFHRRDRVWIVANSNDSKRRAVDTTRVDDRRGDGSDSVQGWEKIPSGPESSSKEGAASKDQQHVAHTEGKRCSEARSDCSGRTKRTAGASASPAHVADATVAGLQVRERARQQENEAQGGKCVVTKFKRRGDDPRFRQRLTEPGMGDLVDGLSTRMDGIGLSASEWPPEPDIPRVASGIPDRPNRLKALGNAVVPQIPEMIGHAILEARKQAA